jgi:hypothetical protein
LFVRPHNYSFQYIYGFMVKVYHRCFIVNTLNAVSEKTSEKRMRYSDLRSKDGEIG